MSTLERFNDRGTIVTYCQECGNPWGVILGLKEIPSPEHQSAAQTAMEESLCEILESGLGDSDSCYAVNLTEVPVVDLDEVVFITDATARFASEYFGAECVLGGSVWQRRDDLDIPEWLLRGRKRRWAYVWDCCSLQPDSLLKRAFAVKEAVSHG